MVLRSFWSVDGRVGKIIDGTNKTAVAEIEELPVASYSLGIF